jgi:hypothetical protein
MLNHPINMRIKCDKMKYYIKGLLLDEGREWCMRNIRE